MSESVEQWYVLRVTYQRELIAKRFFDEKNRKKFFFIPGEFQNPDKKTVSEKFPYFSLKLSGTFFETFPSYEHKMFIALFPLYGFTIMLTFYCKKAENMVL